MCDWSLESVKSRKAQIGDHLIVSNFAGSVTRGLASIDDPECAVCLEPGAEVAFDSDIRACTYFASSLGNVARVREVDTENPYTHHDALETASGKLVMVAQLELGQTCTVLQIGRDEPVTELVEIEPAQQLLNVI